MYFKRHQWYINLYFKDNRRISIKIQILNSINRNRRQKFLLQKNLLICMYHKEISSNE